jgi:hypothetical protein
LGTGGLIGNGVRRQQNMLSRHRAVPSRMKDRANQASMKQY